jgi:hypothetical protein
LVIGRVWFVTGVHDGLSWHVYIVCHRGLLEISLQDGLTGLFTTHTDPWVGSHNPAR